MEKRKKNQPITHRLTFKQICYTLGVTPAQRVMLIRYFNLKKGGVDSKSK